MGDPESESNAIETRNLNHLSFPRAVSNGERSASALAEVVQQYRTDGNPSEAKSALHIGIAPLHDKIEHALKRIKDPARKHIWISCWPNSAGPLEYVEIMVTTSEK